MLHAHSHQALLPRWSNQHSLKLSAVPHTPAASHTPHSLPHASHTAPHTSSPASVRVTHNNKRRPTLLRASAPEAPTASGSSLVSQNLMDAFNKEGFVHIPAVVSEEEMSQLEPTYFAFLSGEIAVPETDIFDMGAAGNRKHVAPALVSITSPRKYHPEWQNDFLEKRLQVIAEQIMDTDEVELDFDQIQAKRPSCRDSVMPWNQERAYLPDGLPEECENSVSCWVAVTDIPMEGGCLRFIPGSHKSNIRKHTPVHAKMTKEEAEAAEAAAAEEAPHALKALVAGGERAAMVPIKRGDVVVASDRVVYGSGPNNSPNWRCHYVINFKRTECVVSERMMGIENPHTIIREDFYPGNK